MHYNATLVFITEGSALTDYQQPKIKDDIAAAYSFWQNRLLVTPVPANDWSGNERILSSFFKLLFLCKIYWLEQLLTLYNLLHNYYLKNQ